MRALSVFNKFAKIASTATGHPVVFTIAVTSIVLWAITGPVFHFSDTWQLVVNTATSVITFLMVFLIQNTQNRDTAAMHVKLDEIIRAIKGAHNALLNLEELDQADIDRVRAGYEDIARKAADKVREGKRDTGNREESREK